MPSLEVDIWAVMMPSTAPPGEGARREDPASISPLKGDWGSVPRRISPADVPEILMKKEI
jgi:hypothetical protein